jgi:SAM-dependent methyltransferase
VLRKEAIWLGDQIYALDPDRVFPLCDVGSSTGDFRHDDQPWIDEHLFKPARTRGRTVRYADLKPAAGVDLVGDLTDPRFVQSLRRTGFRSILCANVLEHVPDPAAIAAALVSAVAPGGYVFVTCPYRFPIHPDPIDTGFRPSPDELSRLFPGTTVRSQAVVRDGSYLSMLRRNPARFLRKSARTAGPLTTSSSWQRIVHHVPWLFRQFQVSCVVLQT